MRTITKHIIHCSDSDFGDVTEIRRWHKSRGFNDVGYHFIIRTDGEIELGRMLHEIGAHTKGVNQESIGTCLIGKDSFSVEQFNALKRLHHSLTLLFPRVVAYPHHMFNKQKTCPNFDVLSVLGEKGVL